MVGVDAEDLDAKMDRLADELHMAVGQAISLWASVETSLLHLFAAATGMPLRTCAALFIHIKTFALALELVDAAVREGIEGSRAVHRGKRVGVGRIALTRWTSLVEYTRELSGERNYLAHAPVTGHLDSAYAEGPVCLVGPPPVAHHAGLGVDLRRPPLDLSEVRELTSDFMHALTLIEECREGFETHGPLPEKYLEPVVRRRPPRKQRLESARRTPKAPPRSSPA